MLEWISCISGVVAAAGVLVGVVFAVLQIRNLVKTRQTDLIIRLYSAYCSKEIRKAVLKVYNLEFDDYNDLVKKHGPLTSEDPVNIALTTVGIYYEGIGILAHRKLVDIEMVSDLLNGPIRRTWEKMKPIAEGARKQLNQPQLFEWFEELYNEMQKRKQSLQQTQQ